MVTHHPEDGKQPEGSILQTWNLALKLNLGVLPPQKNSRFKDIVQKGGREVNPISKK